MRDLDGRLTGRRLVVEGQQPVVAVGFQRRLDRCLRDVEGVELADRDPPARVLASLAERDQPQEDLLDRPPPLGIGGRVEEVRAGCEGARHPAHLPVRGQREPIPIPSLEELRERVLQQRQSAGLVRDVGDHLGDETRLEEGGLPFRRSADRLLQLVGGERRNRLVPRRQELAEPRVHERPVVVIRSERHDHPEPAARIECRDSQRFQGELAFPLVGRQREQFLELIHDEEQLRIAGTMWSALRGGRGARPGGCRRAASADASRPAAAPTRAHRAGASRGTGPRRSPASTSASRLAAAPAPAPPARRRTSRCRWARPRRGSERRQPGRSTSSGVAG